MAYLSLMFTDSPIARIDTAIKIGGAPLDEGQVYGAVVDAATVSFADASAVTFTPENDDWYTLSDHWEARMDDPSHYFQGVANVELPGTSPQLNMILCHSGWGDGFYPIIESYDAEGNVNGIHIDLQVLGDIPHEEK
ncbi:hypothetical protein AXK60_24730 [Tsukamurella pseudospumae]|uniref:Uncharacterized protein n=2 Tax=Tsukamurella pseudospumae TaxID=239498 RepID=A0A138AME6_9ACTN|nr:hypothetical protein AXK60_24730 [Tsukamurella pseudospumae]